MTASSAPADPPSSDRGDGDASETSESTNDEVTRPPLVIRRVATATRGKGRVKPRKAQMETLGDGKTLADLPRVDGTRGATSHDPATFHLLASFLSLRSLQTDDRLFTSKKIKRVTRSYAYHCLADASVRETSRRLSSSPSSTRAAHPDERLDDPPATMPHYVTENDLQKCVCVPVFDCSDVRSRNAARAAMRRGEPAVLRNARLLVPGSIPGWSDGDTDSEGFRGFAASGSGDERAWRVMLSSSAEKKRNRFYPLEHATSRASLKESRNELGAPYRVRRPETSLTRLTARDFAQCASAWRERGAYFEDEIAAINRDERFPNGDTSPKPVDGGDGLGKTVLDAIDWATLRDDIAVPQRFGALRAVVLSAGTRGSILPLRVPLASGIRGGASTTAKTKTFSRNVFSNAPVADGVSSLDPKPSRVVPDTHGLEVSQFDIDAEHEATEASNDARDDSGFETVEIQLLGRRRVTLITPDQTYRGVYPFPIAHPLDGRSAVDWSDVDYARFPNAANVRGAVAILEPGDGLFVPEAFWRHEHGLSAAHAHATVRFARSDSGLGSDDVSSARDIGYRVPKSLAVGRPRTAAASVFFVGRAVEQMVSRSEGDRDARHWLEVCARREESAWVDLGSVAGCRRVDLFRRVRQAVDQGLPPPKVGVDAFRAALQKEFKGTEFKGIEFKGIESAGSSLALTAPPSLRGQVSVLTAATERETRGAGRHERFLLELIDGRLDVDDPHPSWVDDDFFDPVFVSEATKQLLANANAEATFSAKEDADGDATSDAHSARSDRALPLVDAKNVDAKNLRVALPGGGVLTSRAKRLPDDRTDAERAFPEMFVEKLVKKGWSETKHTPISVLNPEHPNFVGKKP